DLGQVRRRLPLRREGQRHALGLGAEAAALAAQAWPFLTTRTVTFADAVAVSPARFVTCTRTVFLPGEENDVLVHGTSCVSRENLPFPRSHLKSTIRDLYGDADALR